MPKGKKQGMLTLRCECQLSNSKCQIDMAFEVCGIKQVAQWLGASIKRVV